MRSLQEGNEAGSATTSENRIRMDLEDLEDMDRSKEAGAWEKQARADSAGKCIWMSGEKRRHSIKQVTQRHGKSNL